MHPGAHSPLLPSLCRFWAGGRLCQLPALRVRDQSHLRGQTQRQLETGLLMRSTSSPRTASPKKSPFCYLVV